MSVESRLQQLENNHVKTIDDYSKLYFLEFSEKIIGLPRHPATAKQLPFMKHQLDFAHYVLNENGQKKVLWNKSRQIGASEIVLRVLQYQAMSSKFANKKILIICGTRIQTCKSMMQRFKLLFNNIPKEITESNDLVVKLKNGCSVEAYPSNSDSIRGLTNVAAIMVDEAAFFGLVNDSVVMDAIQPIIMTNKSNIYIISTPNGPMGFFYKLYQDNDSDYYKFTNNIYAGIPVIYTKDEAEIELARTDIDVQQEYMNSFTVGRNSVFGEIDDEDIEPGELWE